MKSTYSKRELDKIHELERQYTDDGFEVSVQPDPKSLPSFLRDVNYKPDLIATSKNESHIVEVTSIATVKKLKRLTSVANAVEAQPKWKFVLVVTNPREGASYLKSPPTKTTTQLHKAIADVELLESFSSKAGNKYDYALLLAAWAVFEAALRYKYVINEEEIRATNSKSVVRDAVMLGLLRRTESAFLEHVAQKRNRIAHGDITTPVSKNDLKRLIGVTKRLVESDESDK